MEAPSFPVEGVGCLVLSSSFLCLLMYPMYIHTWLSTRWKTLGKAAK